MIALLVAVLVCIGCHGLHVPGLSGGSGRLAGTFTFLAPVLTTSDSPVASASNLSFGELVLPGSIGVFESDEAAFAVKSIYRNKIEYSQADPTQGIWPVAFNFVNLPLGALNLRIYNLTSPDWNIYDYQEYYRSEAINLGSGRRRVVDYELTRDMRGAAERGRIHGKVYINGQPIGESQVRLALGANHLGIPEGNDPFYPGDPYERLTWTIPSGSASNGRLFYEVSELGYGDYYTTNGVVREGQPLPTEPQFTFATGVALSVTHQEAEVDLYSANHPYPSVGSTLADRCHLLGTIKVNLHLDCVAPWPGDIVLAADPSDGSPAINRRAYKHIHPMEVGSSDDIECQLYYLPVGGYYVRMLLLGETNTDAVTELLSSELINLKMPDPNPASDGQYYNVTPTPLHEMNMEVGIGETQ